MRLKITIVSCIALALFCGFAIHYSTGIVGVTKKPNHVFGEPGCICHDQNSAVRVWITGPETLAAGRQAQYRISIAKQTNIAAGFNVAAWRGILGIVDSVGTQLISPNGDDTLELAHTNPRFGGGRDTISWQFFYRAPLTIGSIDTLYANANSIDTSQDPAGDAWNFAPNFLVRVANPNAVAEEPLTPSFRLLQNYPNPFNPTTTIRYELVSESHVTLTVFDVAGREVVTLVRGMQRAGVHAAAFDAGLSGQLASGIYLYRLSVVPFRSSSETAFVEVKKMIMAK